MRVYGWMDLSQLQVHLLVVGVEVSLWVAEQFAADVTEFLPGASATAVSANQLVGGEKVYFSARDSKGSLSLSALSEAHTVVLVLSQSGQTFPALKATARLCARLGDRVFIMVCERNFLLPDFVSSCYSLILNVSKQFLFVLLIMLSPLRSSFALLSPPSQPLKSLKCASSFPFFSPPRWVATKKPRLFRRWGAWSWTTTALY